MVELDIVEFLDIIHQFHNLIFKRVHLGSKRVFLTKIMLPHFIKSIIINFEHIFNPFLMIIQFLHHLLFLSYV